MFRATVGHTRLIPFSVKSAVREQIGQIMAENILEISTSSDVNPLTILLKDGKASRICVDARKLNRYTVPDSARVLHIPQLLKQFHGSKCITITDLSLPFLQIGLKWKSIQYILSYIYSQAVRMVLETLSSFSESTAIDSRVRYV
jgi:hypothetical protein